MSYQPNIEDIAQLAMDQPERFSNAQQTLTSIRNAMQADEVQREALETATTQAHYNDFLSNGGQPLTESPIPADSEPPEAASSLDVSFGSPCISCQQDDGCCLMAGSVTDKENENRKVQWPPVEDATTLLVVAKPQDGETDQLTAAIEVAWEGNQRCRQGRVNCPSIIASGVEGGLQHITAQQQTVTAVYDQPVRLAESLSDFIPFDVTLGLMAFDALIGGHVLEDQGGVARFQPRQCMPGKDIGMALNVIPYPYTKLEGDIKLAVETVIMTTEVSASVSATGTLKGQYGRHTLDWSRSANASGGQPKSVPRQNDAPGLIGLLVDTIQTMDEYVSKGKPSGTVEYDRSSMGSGVTLSKSLSFKPEGFELVPMAGTPDLQLKIGSLSSSLEIGVTGRIDLIEAISALILSPASARLIQDARTRMAEGERVNATVEGYLELAATGTLQHILNGESGTVAYRIPASGGEMEASAQDVTSDFTGTLKILGRAELKLHVEGRVFLLRAQAGMRGSIHTSWMWEVQTNDEGKREKRYTFEGVKVSGEAYAELTSKDEGDEAGLGGREEATLELVEPETHETVADRVAANMDASEENASRMLQDDAQGDDGNGKTIWPGKPGEWVPL